MNIPRGKRIQTQSCSLGGRRQISGMPKQAQEVQWSAYSIQASHAVWQDERKVQVEADCAERHRITVPLWTVLAVQHLAPHVVFPPLCSQGGPGHSEEVQRIATRVNEFWSQGKDANERLKGLDSYSLVAESQGESRGRRCLKTSNKYPKLFFNSQVKTCKIPRCFR